MKKYRGVFPAMYACYDAEGRIHPKGVRQLTGQLCAAGVGGIYVNGSCGECGALSVMEKVAVLENVMAEAAGRARVICRVTCSDPEDTRELCRHAAACGVDGIVALPQEDGSLLLRFDAPQRAVTPGQAAVLYDGEEVLGGGTIFA